MFLQDVLECCRGQARKEPLAAINDSVVIVAMLHCVGLETRSPPLVPPGPLPKPEPWAPGAPEF